MEYCLILLDSNMCMIKCCGFGNMCWLLSWLRLGINCDMLGKLGADIYVVCVVLHG